ncbi:hypothetical protein Poly51_22600 [Rubripirellula tenax]|uniref:DUF1800 domain-containing protein n=1 Tax=Rubripirellula tenax TaxID=2528015 RepID=A0A5C6FFF4_9BACT|nr:DUF1800 family protein [Rubripirellula tenax]TWU59472.1 hypothetical protein Poly51_22600 [Rubripirellula tenax]
MSRFQSVVLQSEFSKSFLVLVLLIAIPATATAGTFEVGSRSQAKLMKNKVHASQFLSRATFGPTIADIDTLAGRIGQVGVRQACSEWIDAQFLVPATEHQPLAEQMFGRDGYNGTEDGVWIQRYRYHAWWTVALQADDQLRQRLAWALSQILVTSEDGAGFNDRNTGNISNKARWLGPTNYYDTLVKGAFGNYRQLLQDVTYHPVMGVYLSHMRNRKTNGVRFPDENYAREVMQLFSIGLYELHQDGRLKTSLSGELIPTYDNETIKDLARIFTGLTFKPSDTSSTGRFFYSGYDFLYPMEMAQHEHDTESKTLFGNQTINLTDGNQEVSAALDILHAHDNIAPFVSFRLIQRLVKSNPSRGYIRRVANAFDDNGQGVKGDMKAVVKAILLDPEAWRSIRIQTQRLPDRVTVLTRGTEYSRLREPVVRYTSMLRGLEANSDDANGWAMMTPRDYDWTQEPYKSPSVFNFFLPSFQPPGELISFQPSRRIPNGDLVAPEFQQQTAVTANRLMNRYIWDLSRGGALFTASNGTVYNLRCDMTFNLDADRALVNDDNLTNKGSLTDAEWEVIQRAEAAQSDLVTLIDKYDLLFCSGTMPQDFKDDIAYVVLKETDWMIGNTGGTPQWQTRAGEFRVLTTLISILTSPFAAIEE